MNNELLNKLAKSLSDTRIDKIKPNPDLIEKVLSIQGIDFPNIQDHELSQHLYTLSQYLVFLNLQCNARQIKFLEAKRKFEFEQAKLVATIEGKTIKERESTAILNNEVLQTLEKDMRQKEYDFILFNKVPDSVTEIVNAIKKELSVRNPQQFKSTKAY